MSQFIIPDFIKNADVNKIHKRMRDNLPNDIDKSEGSDVWNLTYPTAYEHAYFAQFCILNALRLIWPEFSYGTYADYHGACRGMARRKAQHATGSVKIIGNIGVNIPKGTVFTTAQIADESVTEFVTTENVSIGDNREMFRQILSLLIVIKLSVYPVLQMKQLQQAAIMKKVMKILLSVSRNMTSHRIILLSEMITITDVGRWKLTEWVRLL